MGTDKNDNENLYEIENSPVEIIDPRPKKKKTGRKIFGWIALFLIFVTIGYLYFQNKDKNNQSVQKPAKDNTENVSAQIKAQNTLLTENYENRELAIKIKHPPSWGVKETKTSIVISSPEFKVDTVDAQVKNAFFKIYIKKGATKNDAKYIGRATAIEKSKLYKYDNPGSSQLKKTYITPFGLDTPDGFALFIAQGTYNLNKSDTLGPSYAQEPEAILIAGGYYSNDTEDELDFLILPRSSFKDYDEYKTAIKIVQSLQLM